ncbi:hypothetical protein JD969_01020 [Planctomycetota bacterium]|nr:hypothetical protein JD969_01020 [Planctomycetota bacterium]
MIKKHTRRIRVTCKRFIRNQRGATMLEWLLVVGAIVLPSYVVIQILLDTLVGYYQMSVEVNGLPFP